MRAAARILKDLRIETRPLHHSLESRLGVLSPDFTRDRYLFLLQRFYGFYVPVEACIAPYGDEPAAWLDGDRRKLPWLRADLLALGTDDRAIDCLPRCRALPDVSGPLQQLGCMYVLEGATLGGQVILRHVRSRLRLNGAGTTFFDSYRDKVGAMWGAFRARIEREGAKVDARDTIVRSACATFAALERWCSSGEVR